jgi:hypothetical protein
VSKSDLAAQALPALETLVASDENKLFTELGARLQMNRSDPRGVTEFTPHAEPEYETLGLRDDLANFGKKYFERVNQQCYNLVCGSEAEDSGDRDKLVAAFSLGKADVAAALAALLVSQLAIAPAIAAVVAAIAIKLFFAPAHGTMCELWRQKVRAKSR